MPDVINSSEMPYHASSTDGDLLPVVDEQDRVIGAAPRSEVHARKLRHRAVHIVIVDEHDRVLLQRRSMRKDSHPGWWDISVGGHVDAGEEYPVAAARELVEEMGLVADFREVAQRTAAPDSGWEFVRIYETIHGGDVDFNRQEIDEVRWEPLAELIAKASPSHDDPHWRVTGSGWISILSWARATGRTT